MCRGVNPTTTADHSGMIAWRFGIWIPDFKICTARLGQFDEGVAASLEGGSVRAWLEKGLHSASGHEQRQGTQ